MIKLLLLLAAMLPAQADTGCSNTTGSLILKKPRIGITPLSDAMRCINDDLDSLSSYVALDSATAHLASTQTFSGRNKFTDIALFTGGAPFNGETAGVGLYYASSIGHVSNWTTVSGGIGVLGEMDFHASPAVFDATVQATLFSGSGASLTNLPWSSLTGFPSGCSPGSFVTTVGGTLTCGTPTSYPLVLSVASNTLNGYILSSTQVVTGSVTVQGRFQADSLIYTNGTSVGIGSSSPSGSYALDVVGNVRLSGNLAASGGSSIISAANFLGTGNGGVDLRFQPNGGQTNFFNGDGAAVVSITGSVLDGKMGIGTTSPATYLNVKQIAAGTDVLRLDRVASATGNPLVLYSSGGYYLGGFTWDESDNLARLKLINPADTSQFHTASYANFIFGNGGISASLSYNSAGFSFSSGSSTRTVSFVTGSTGLIHLNKRTSLGGSTNPSLAAAEIYAVSGDSVALQVSSAGFKAMELTSTGNLAIGGTMSGSSISGGTFGAVNGSALTSITAANLSAGSLPSGVIASSLAAITTAGTYGSATVIPTFNLRADGRITFASSNTVTAGVSYPLDLATSSNVATTLPMDHGGTGTTSLTNKSVIFSNGSSLTHDPSYFAYERGSKAASLSLGTGSPYTDYTVLTMQGLNNAGNNGMIFMGPTGLLLMGLYMQEGSGNETGNHGEDGGAVFYIKQQWNNSGVQDTRTVFSIDTRGDRTYILTGGALCLSPTNHVLSKCTSAVDSSGNCTCPEPAGY